MAAGVAAGAAAGVAADGIPAAAAVIAAGGAAAVIAEVAVAVESKVVVVVEAAVCLAAVRRAVPFANQRGLWPLPVLQPEIQTDVFDHSTELPPVARPPQRYCSLSGQSPHRGRHLVSAGCSHSGPIDHFALYLDNLAGQLRRIVRRLLSRVSRLAMPQEQRREELEPPGGGVHLGVEPGLALVRSVAALANCLAATS